MLRALALAGLVFMSPAQHGKAESSAASPAPGPSVPAHAKQTNCEDRRIEPQILELVAAVATPEVGRFIAREHFFVDGNPTRAGVKFSTLSENFMRHFDIAEESIPAARLRIHLLRDAAVDTAIIASLDNRHETNLAHLWAMLSQQGDGRAGPLLTNGGSNIFYIRDAKGVMQAVSATWNGGWEIDAHSIAGPFPWRVGRQVVSR